jgi:UDP-N-acetylmuramoyl-tripeptide--D-alanyl-D-alanine ligase
MIALWTSAEAKAATLGNASKPFEVTGLSIDTRTTKPGDLFIAVKSERDGHEFVRAAFEAKAGAALVSRALDDINAPLLTVANTQRGLEDLARASRARTHAKIIAVTGSAGKTTTKEILKLAFSALGRTHASAASHNNHLGVPLTLASMPRESEYGVFEVGMNHYGELRNLVSFVRPHVALITTIAPAHLEFFGSCEAIADAKSEIFEGIVPGGAALLPSDSPYYERLAARAKQVGVSTVRTFGAKGDARLLAMHESEDGMKIESDLMGRAVHFTIGAPGKHIATNAIGALLAVASLDGDVLNAAAALSHFAAMKGRGARFRVPVSGGNVEVIDESYNANPASMAMTIAMLGATPTKGRRIAVLGDMLEMGTDGAKHHAALARDIENARVDLVFANGPAMRAMWDKLPASRRGAHAETSAEIAPKFMDAIRPGDVILVKGSNGSKMSVIIDALKARASV